MEHIFEHSITQFSMNDLRSYDEERGTNYYSIHSLKIDAEFKNLLVPQRQEYEQLETNIKQQGCLEPLTIWNRIIIDGHKIYIKYV